MYTLIHSLPFQQLLVEQLPSFVISLIIAEMFYKFHSFTLETIAFLATWYVVNAVVQWVRQSVGK